jgi:hypothetical protein
MAGRLNLAITGIQDQWLTGEPEFSYFLMNFKRHTKFAIEAIESPFDGNTDFDEIIECRIPKNKGDLIRSTMLKFTLPNPTTPGKSFNVTFQSTGSGNKYFIDGVQQATLTLYEGTTYTFNNASHPSHPFRFAAGSLDGNPPDELPPVDNIGTLYNYKRYTSLDTATHYVYKLWLNSENNWAVPSTPSSNTIKVLKVSPFTWSDNDTTDSFPTSVDTTTYPGKVSLSQPEYGILTEKYRFSVPIFGDYTTGVTDPSTSTVTFVVPVNAPSTLYYYCSVHSNMGGQINVKTLRYRESIGAQIIEYADLLIGGQTIERLTGDYIYMYNQIHNNKDDIDQTLYFLMGHGNYIPVSYDWDYSVFLPFYFFRHASLAIPICALTKQLVEIRIKFKKQEDVSVTYTRSSGSISEPPSNVVSSIKKVSLVTDFFFITDDEKNFLLTRPIEYVITQLQVSQFKFNPGVSKKSGMLNFKNPVKEMFFVAVSDDVHKYEPIKQVTMKFNNNTIIDADNLMVSYEQPLKYYTGVTDNKFGVYSFSMTPETYYPTGQVNMSRIAHNLIEIELETPDASFGHKVYVYAVNYNVLHIQSGLGGLKF